MGPAVLHFRMSLRDRHLQRSVRHFEGNKFLPVPGPDKSSSGFEALVERGCRQWGEQSEDGQARGPGSDFLQRTFGHPSRVIVHAKNKRGDRVDIAFSKPFQHGSILAGLVESLVHVFEIGWIDGLHADEYPLSSRSRNE